MVEEEDEESPEVIAPSITTHGVAKPVTKVSLPKQKAQIAPTTKPKVVKPKPKAVQPPVVVKPPEPEFSWNEFDTANHVRNYDDSEVKLEGEIKAE